MPREKSIQSKVLEYLNGLPFCIAENVSGNAQQSGRADINACYGGLCLRIELKSPDHNNTTSVKQDINLMKWKAAGAATAVCYSLDEVKALISKIQKDNRWRTL